MKRALLFVTIFFFSCVLRLHDICWAGPVVKQDVPDLPSGVSTVPEPISGATAGVIVNSENAQEYKKILIPALYDLLRAAEMSFDGARRLRYVWRFDDDWESRTASFARGKRVSIGKQGLIDTKIELRRGFIFGSRADVFDQPYFDDRGVFVGSGARIAIEESQQKPKLGSRAKAKSKELAYKVLWNINSALWSLGLINFDFELTWIEDNRSVRRALGNFTRVYPSVLDQAHKSEQLFREKIEFTYPGPVRDATWLTFRFRGADEDLVWIYSPVNKKVRQITGSNRADPLLLSAVSLDDFMLWSGKPDLVQANLLRKLVAFAPFPSADMGSLVKDPKTCYSLTRAQASSEGESLRALQSGQWNFETRRFPSSAAWVPSNSIFVPRELLEIELVSRDPYSLYGRQLLYVDSAMMLPVYKIVYDRSGKHWKTIIFSFGLAATKDRSRKMPYPAFMALIDKLENKSYTMSFAKQKYCSSYTDDIKLENFAPTKLGPVGSSL